MASTDSMQAKVVIHGDLNNTEVLREAVEFSPDAAYARRSFAISEAGDDAAVRAKYRPFLHLGGIEGNDWIAKLELSTVLKMVEADMQRTNNNRLKIMVLYGSLRNLSYSKLLAFEQARLLFRLGCDVRVYDPTGLPVKDDEQHDHAKVRELRNLSKWSDGHLWVSPEQHGVLTAVFKNQIDWIPLSSGSVRPTQGRTLAISQVSGGSQSFNTVNTLRILGRWMRMFVVPNQSSVPKAYTQFTPAADPTGGDAYAEAEGGSRMIPSGNRDRVVDCMEEFVKYTLIMRQHFDLFNDRFSERSRRQQPVLDPQAGTAEKEGTTGSVHSANVVSGIDVSSI